MKYTILLICMSLFCGCSEYQRKQAFQRKMNVQVYTVTVEGHKYVVAVDTQASGLAICQAIQ